MPASSTERLATRPAVLRDHACDVTASGEAPGPLDTVDTARRKNSIQSGSSAHDAWAYPPRRRRQRQNSPKPRTLSDTEENPHYPRASQNSRGHQDCASIHDALESQLPKDASYLRVRRVAGEPVCALCGFWGHARALVESRGWPVGIRRWRTRDRPSDLCLVLAVLEQRLVIRDRQQRRRYPHFALRR